MTFLTSLVDSPTFWAESVPAMAGVIGLATLLAWLVLRSWSRRPARDGLWRDEVGAADASDFALTLPFVLLVAMCMAQLALAANASILLHYSAYSAGRAARAFLWERTAFNIRLMQGARQSGSTSVGNIERLSWLQPYGTQSAEACRRASDAARLALIAATPSVVRGNYTVPSGGSCNGSAAWPALTRYTRRLAQTTDVSEAILARRARYAFSPQNTSVAVSLSAVDNLRLGRAFGRSERLDALPITARVTFRYPLILPVGRLFGTRGADGLVTRRLSASVRVL